MPVLEIAELIAPQAGRAGQEHRLPQDAEAHFGFLAGLIQMDNPTSSALTRQLLGWEPSEPDLLDDLEHGHYFG